jgi:SpoVK/Ycf46/Vps4 family AAA+-type ATPase
MIFDRIARLTRRAMDLLGDEATGAHSSEEMPLSDERMDRLVHICQLDALAVDVLVCLCAVELDPFMRTVIRGLQRETGKPWIEIGTIAELLAIPPSRVPELGRLFATQGPYRRWGLLQVDDAQDAPLVATRVKIASRVAQYLAGSDELPDGLSLARGDAALDDSLAPAEDVQRLLRRIRRAESSLVVEIAGGPGSGKQHLAEALTKELHSPLLILDLAKVATADLSDRIAELRREARLNDSLVCLAHADAHILAPPSEIEGAPPGAAFMPPALEQFLRELRGVSFLTVSTHQPLIERHVQVARIAIPPPTPSQRAALFAHALGAAQLDDDVDLTALARRHALPPGRIKRTAETALALASSRELEPRPISRADLLEASRGQLEHDLQSLATRVTASHRWEDLVIPVEVYEGLREMIAYARHGQRVYEEWDFGPRHSLSQGISALFTGPPGTGKTMCASVMARELDMELFRVDLSRLVSKWIGETERNLSKVFDEAEQSNAIILFDEADSLFAKRTEVKTSVDRYANLEVNFLLQRMEAFSGVTILTSNFEDTIDSAFKRRLTFRLRFEKPDADARAALWQKMFPPSAPIAPDTDFARLASRFEMSGGNIRNAAVRAAFLAAEEERPIDTELLMRAAERESSEMGLLTRTEPPARAPEEASEPEEPPPQPRTTGRARTIPISHPRR